MRVGGWVLLAGALSLALGCKDVGGDGAPTGPGDPSGPGTPAAGQGPRRIVVEIEGFAFRGPDGSSSIAAAVGDTLEFVNRDAAPHTATATAAPAGATAFDSGRLNQGDVYRVVVAAAGAWSFICDFHPSMTGTVAATTAAGTPPAAPPATPPPASPPATPPGGAPGPGPGPTPPPATGTIVVDIVDDAFRGPDGSSRIVIAPGQTVEFVNRDGSSHTATSTGTPAGGAPFDSGRLRQGETFRFTPATEGTWPFRCDFHPEMVGTLVVSSGGADPGPGSPPGGPAPPAPPPPGGGAGTVVVELTDGGFQGNVTLALGQAIEWRNTGTAEHELDSTDEPDDAADFRSGELGPGERFRFVPDRTGVWVYRCKEHDGEEEFTITVG